MFRRLGELARRDTNIVLAFVVLTNLLRAVSTVILTRLLAPEVFGISGVIAAIQFTVVMASDLGIQVFVVRHEDGDKPRFLDCVWTISLIRSLGLTVVLAVLAEPLARVFGKPDLAPIVAASALCFAVEGIASLTLLTAVRRRQVLRLSLLEFVVLVVQLVITAVLAYFWRNFWAILAGQMAGSALKSFLSYVMFSDSRRRLAFDRGYTRDLWSFARFITGSSLIFLLLAQIDKLVLARAMSLDEFGLYILAGNLAMAPLAFATAYASRVLYPTYSQLWRDGCHDLRAQFYARRWLPSVLYSFVAGGLIGSAPLVVAVLYDPRYAAAALYLQILAIPTLLALASTSSNETLTATGQVRATFEANVARLVWMAIAGPLAYVFHGAFGLVVVVGLMEIPSILLKWVRMHRAALLDLRQELTFLGFGGTGVAVGAGTDLLLRPFVP